jgi:hypothetical protein
MGTTRAAGRPVPRRRKHDEARRSGVGVSAGAGAGGSGVGGNSGNSGNSGSARPLISGPAPFQLPRWPLRPLEEAGDAEAAANADDRTEDDARPAAAAAAASLAQQRFRVAFEDARADAIALGVPSSALPAPREGTAEELAAALAHTEDVIASFQSANI